MGQRLVKKSCLKSSNNQKNEKKEHQVEEFIERVKETKAPEVKNVIDLPPVAAPPLMRTVSEPASQLLSSFSSDHHEKIKQAPAFNGPDPNLNDEDFFAYLDSLSSAMSEYATISDAESHSELVEIKEFKEVKEVKEVKGKTVDALELKSPPLGTPALQRAFTEPTGSTTAHSEQPAEVKVACPAMDPTVCPICFTSSSVNERVCPCGSESCGFFCTDCFTMYITKTLEAALGACPLIKCPGSCRTFLPFTKWSKLVPSNICEDYIKCAKDMLTLQCASCHTRGTLYRATDAQDGDLAKFISLLAVQYKFSDTLRFQRSLKAYLDHKITPALMFQVIKSSFSLTGINNVRYNLQRRITAMKNKLPQEMQETRDIENRLRFLQKDFDFGEDSLLGLNDLFGDGDGTDEVVEVQVEEKAEPTQEQAATAAEVEELEQKKNLIQTRNKGIADRINKDIDKLKEDLSLLPMKEATLDWLMKKLLSCIADVERRSSLHLRYCVEYPKVTSLCCQYQHCFHCRTRDHPDRPCDEVLASSEVDNEIQYCPKCHIATVKGDGCSSLTCVCGYSWSWQMPEDDNVCFDGSPFVYMADHSYRRVRDLVVGDRITTPNISELPSDTFDKCPELCGRSTATITRVQYLPSNGDIWRLIPINGFHISGHHPVVDTASGKPMWMLPVELSQREAIVVDGLFNFEVSGDIHAMILSAPDHRETIVSTLGGFCGPRIALLRPVDDALYGRGYWNYHTRA